MTAKYVDMNNSNANKWYLLLYTRIHNVFARLFTDPLCTLLSIMVKDVSLQTENTHQRIKMYFII